MRKREYKTPINQLFRPATRSTPTQLYNLHQWGNQQPVLPGDSPTPAAATQIPFPKDSPNSNRKPPLVYHPQERLLRASSIPKDYQFQPKQEPEEHSLQEQSAVKKQEEQEHEHEDEQEQEEEQELEHEDEQEHEEDQEQEEEQEHEEVEEPEQPVENPYQSKLYSLKMASSDPFINPTPFYGSVGSDASTFWTYLEDWFSYKGWRNIPAPAVDATDAVVAAHAALQAEGERKMKEFFPLIFRLGAHDWFTTLEDADKATLASMRNCFKERYMPVNNKSQTIADVWNTRQLKNESVDNYYVSLRKLAKLAGVDNEEHLKHALVNGLLPEIKREVILSNPDNILGVLNLARRVEQANLLLRKTEAQMEQATINDVTSTKISGMRNRENNSPSPQRSTQKVHFEDRAHTHESRDQRTRESDNYVSQLDRKHSSPGESYANGRRSSPPTATRSYDRQSNRQQGGNQARSPSNHSQDSRGRSPSYGLQSRSDWNRGTSPAISQPKHNWSQGNTTNYHGRQQQQQQQQQQTSGQRCRNCNRSHARGECPAFGRNCYNCGIRNHFQQACRSRNQRSNQRF